MNLQIGMTKEIPSNLKNYKGEDLLQHTIIIFDEDESTPESLCIVHEWDSTFISKWKERDVLEAARKAKRIIKAIMEDPTMLERNEISYKIDPSQVVVTSDEYENDCKVYKQ